MVSHALYRRSKQPSHKLASNISRIFTLEMTVNKTSNLFFFHKLLQAI